MKVLWRYNEVNPFRCCAEGAAPDGGGGASGGAPASGSGGGTSAAPSSPSTAPSSPSSSPSGATASPSAPSASEASAGEAFDFSAIFEGPSESAAPPSIPTPQAAPVVPPQASPPAAVPTQQGQPVAQPPPQAAPAASQPTATSTELGQAPTAPALPPLDAGNPASVAAHLENMKDAAIAHVAERLFKLTPEEIDGLETDVVNTVPKLLARTFVTMQQTMLQSMARMVPQMMVTQGEAIKRNQSGEDAFFAAWPGIPRDKVGVVRQYASAYRVMHPNDSQATMFANLGPMMHMVLKIPMQGGQPQTQTQAGTAKPSPFTPAVGGAAGGLPTAHELSPIEAMFMHQD